MRGSPGILEGHVCTDFEVWLATACFVWSVFFTLFMLHGALLPPASQLSNETCLIHYRGYMQGDGQLPVADDVTFK